MRIAVYQDLPSGGAKRAVYETLQRLVKEHAVDVYTLNTANHTFCDLRPFVAGYHVYDYQPLSLFESPLGRLNQLQRWRDLQRLSLVARQMACDIDEQGYDVVYVHPCMWTQAPMVLQYLHTPSLYHVHEPLRSLYEPPIPRPHTNGGNGGLRTQIDRVDPLLRLYQSSLRATDRLSTRKASLLLTNSEFTRTNVIQIYERQAEVAYFGVDTNAFVPLNLLPLDGGPIEDAKEERIVLSVGAIRPAKGFDFLIESLALIPKSLRPTLLLIGNDADQNERAYLTQLAQQLDVKLVIETMVRHDELVQHYNRAQIVVYAPIREPFGFVPLEAMACGTPVVCVAEGGVCETVVDGVNGLLVPRDPAHFATAVSTLLDDAPLCERLGQQAREYVLARWTWDSSVQRIERYLSSVADADGRQQGKSPKRKEL